MINKVFINGYQKLILRLYLARLSVKISSRGVCQPINKTFFQSSCPLRNRQPCRYSILLVVKERPKTFQRSRRNRSPFGGFLYLLGVENGTDFLLTEFQRPSLVFFRAIQHLRNSWTYRSVRAQADQFSYLPVFERSIQGPTQGGFLFQRPLWFFLKDIL